MLSSVAACLGARSLPLLRGPSHTPSTLRSTADDRDVRELEFRWIVLGFVLLEMLMRTESSDDIWCGLSIAEAFTSWELALLLRRLLARRLLLLEFLLDRELLDEVDVRFGVLGASGGKFLGGCLSHCSEDFGEVINFVLAPDRGIGRGAANGDPMGAIDQALGVDDDEVGKVLDNSLVEAEVLGFDLTSPGNFSDSDMLIDVSSGDTICADKGDNRVALMVETLKFNSDFNELGGSGTEISSRVSEATVKSD